jgi:hypothetical protein
VRRSLIILMISRFFGTGSRSTTIQLARMFACRVCDAEKFERVLICPQCSEVVPVDSLQQKSAFGLFGL